MCYPESLMTRSSRWSLRYSASHCDSVAFPCFGWHIDMYAAGFCNHSDTRERHSTTWFRSLKVMKRLLSADYIVRILHQCSITVVRRVSAAISSSLERRDRRNTWNCGAVVFTIVGSSSVISVSKVTGRRGVCGRR